MSLYGTYSSGVLNKFWPLLVLLIINIWKPHLRLRVSCGKWLSVPRSTPAL